MDLPIIDKSLLAKSGVTNFGALLEPVADNGPRPFDAMAALETFTVEESVKMSYIPQMLIAVGLEQTTLFVNHCAERRLKEYRKYTREMQEYVEEYDRELRSAYGPAYTAYAEYTLNYFERIRVDLARMWYTVGNVANKQLPESKCREIATHVAIIRNVLDYAEKFDSRNDRIIANRLGSSCNRSQNKWLRRILLSCRTVEAVFGVGLKDDESIAMCMRVLTNRAVSMADKYLAEELASKS
jgi:hypothetical protein